MYKIKICIYINPTSVCPLTPTLNTRATPSSFQFSQSFAIFYVLHLHICVIEFFCMSFLALLLLRWRLMCSVLYMEGWAFRSTILLRFWWKFAIPSFPFPIHITQYNSLLVSIFLLKIPLHTHTHTHTQHEQRLFFYTLRCCHYPIFSRSPFTPADMCMWAMFQPKRYTHEGRWMCR